MLETKASVTLLRAPATRFGAAGRKATQGGPTSNPPPMAGEYEGPSAAPPLREREIRRILPGLHIWPRLSKWPRRRTTNTSLMPFESPRTRFDASDSKAIARAQRRSPEITAWVDGPLPCVICTVFWRRALRETPSAGAQAAAVAAAHARRRATCRAGRMRTDGDSTQVGRRPEPRCHALGRNLARRRS